MVDLGTKSRTRSDESTGDVSYDDGFQLLSNHRRRYALQYLYRNGESATLGELAERIAAWENDIRVGEVSSSERKRVYTSLQQIHLPRMDDMDVVEYDDRSGTVELGPAADDLDVYMEIVAGRDVPWSQFYLGLGVVNTVLLGVVAFDVVAHPLTDGAWGLFAATTVLVASVVHTYYNRTEMRLQVRDVPPEVDR